MGIKPVDLEKQTPRASGIYEAIIVAAKRARQIHNDIKIELNQRLETLAALTQTVDSEDETDVSANPDQLKISLEFEQRSKVTEVALQELAGERLEWRAKEEEPAEKKDEEETE
ncbi:MAG: DNA-directed RNA polymerase subunit omega [Ignavibacteriales bacterium]|nr:DNA-directed RNA polymerase subunit omega [Ignavibacteriales bacterium]